MSLKQILNKTTIGSWIMMGNRFSTELIASNAFDWLTVDMEHSGFSTEEMMSQVQIIERSGIAPLVRVGSNDSLLIKRAMDAGAHGVVVPMVNSVEEAKQAVEAVYYPPKGKRGVGLGRATRFGITFNEYKDWLAQNAVVVVQIEHVDAMRNLEGILSVDGVDASIIGPYDLSGSLGHPGEFDRPEVQEFLKQYLDVCKKLNKPAGYHLVQPDVAQAKEKISQGYRFFAFGTDALFLAESVKEKMEGLKL